MTLLIHDGNLMYSEVICNDREGRLLPLNVFCRLDDFIGALHRWQLRLQHQLLVSTSDENGLNYIFIFIHIELLVAQLWLFFMVGHEVDLVVWMLILRQCDLVVTPIYLIAELVKVKADASASFSAGSHLDEVDQLFVLEVTTMDRSHVFGQSLLDQRHELILSSSCLVSESVSAILEELGSSCVVQLVRFFVELVWRLSVIQNTE